jgi:hypothetical protein
MEKYYTLIKMFGILLEFLYLVFILFSTITIKQIFAKSIYVVYSICILYLMYDVDTWMQLDKSVRMWIGFFIIPHAAATLVIIIKHYVENYME